MMYSQFFQPDTRFFAVAASLEMEEQQTVLVVCPLKSIIVDQITEAQSMGISAASAADVSDEELRTANFSAGENGTIFPVYHGLFTLVVHFDFQQVLIGLND